MSVNAYLRFSGNCREAVEFYAEVFGIESTTNYDFWGTSRLTRNTPFLRKRKIWLCTHG